MTDDGSTTQRRIVIRSLAIWLVLICTEIIYGILREPILARLVGHFRSNQIGVFTGSVIIISIACFTIRWIMAKQTREVMTVGFVW